MTSPSSPLSSPSRSLIAGSRATQVPSTAPNATNATATAMCAFRSSFAAWRERRNASAASYGTTALASPAQIRSTTPAMAWPKPMHIAAMP